MEVVWVFILTTIVASCFNIHFYKKGYRSGFRTGAQKVIGEWKEVLYKSREWESEDTTDDTRI